MVFSINSVFVRRWLDKLGLAAMLGLDVVMRQVLIGAGSYHLIDNNLDPLPVRIESPLGLKKKIHPPSILPD